MLMIGSDPELFLEDANGKVISAIGKIGGTKKRPKPVKVLGKGFAVQEDNVLLEYNTPAAKTRNAWESYHRDMLTYLREMVGGIGLALSNKASHSMDADQLQDKRAHIFGCDPDFDAWKLQWNKAPKCEDPNLRSAGGHIHLAYENPNYKDSVKIARLCDLFIGAPLKVVDPDKRRAELYGRPGAIRFKPYGLEYRTPSNYWTLNNDNINRVYDAAQYALAMLDQWERFEGVAGNARAYLAGEHATFVPVTFQYA